MTKKEPQRQPKGTPQAPKRYPQGDPKITKNHEKGDAEIHQFLNTLADPQKDQFSLKVDQKLMKFHPKSFQFRIRISMLFLEGFF